MGREYAGRVRRSRDHSQVLLDASCFRVRGTTRHYGRGSRPRRTRGNYLARWTETQVMVAIALGFVRRRYIASRSRGGLMTDRLAKDKKAVATSSANSNTMF